MKKYALIVAGGRGTRIGGELPKQFIAVAGRPIVMHTIDAFLRYDPDLTIILVLPSESVETWQMLCRKYRFDTPVNVAVGGATRFESVRNGLSRISEPGLVAVHDGARPFVSPTLIARAFDTASRTGSAVPVTEVTDSLREVLPDGRSSVVERSRFRAVQTPQVFDSDLLIGAYRQTDRSSFTDDASVVEQAGFAITLIAGDPDNLKITHPLDLKLAEIRLA